MKSTLVQMTQDILSSMDGDEINSINDNVESMQVATIIKTVYNDIVSFAELTSQKTIFTLNASTDPSKPVVMIKPSNILDIEWLKYDKHIAGDTDTLYEIVSFLDPEMFMDLTLSYNISAGDVTNYTLSFNGQPIQMYCKNDIAPTYYTSFDDTTVVFDSYDQGVDSTLQSSKCVAYGEQNTAFQMIDSFVPPLEDQHFSLLFNEAKALAHAEMKQAEHVLAEKQARKSWVHLQRTKRNVPNHVSELSKLPDYGRAGGYRQDWGGDEMIKLMRKGN